MLKSYLDLAIRLTSSQFAVLKVVVLVLSAVALNKALAQIAQATVKFSVLAVKALMAVAQDAIKPVM